MKYSLYLPDGKQTAVKQGGIVSIASEEWIVLEIDSSRRVALVLSRKELYHSHFNTYNPTESTIWLKLKWEDDSQAIPSTTHYDNYCCLPYNSDRNLIRPWLTEKFYKENLNEQERSFCSEPFLLSPQLYKKHKAVITKNIDRPQGDWWLSQGEKFKYVDRNSEKWAHAVGNQGYVKDGKIVTVDEKYENASSYYEESKMTAEFSHGVRPAMYVYLVANGEDISNESPEALSDRLQRAVDLQKKEKSAARYFLRRDIGILALLLYIGSVGFMIFAVLATLYLDLSVELVPIAAPIAAFLPSIVTIIIAAIFFKKKNVLNAIGLSFVLGNIIYGPILAFRLILFYHE